MICLILAFIQTVCTSESLPSFVQTLKYYAEEYVSTVDAENLVVIIGDLAETTVKAIKEEEKVMNKKLDSIQFRFTFFAVSVGLLLVITWIILCSYIAKQRTMLQNSLHNSYHMKKF